MKIAILTQPLKENYGGILQAYALQSIIKNLGHTPVTIDRQYNRRSWFRVALSRTKHFILSPKKSLSKPKFNLDQQAAIFKNTIKFIDKNISLTKKIDSDKKLKTHFSETKYDAVVVGSDQTWRPCYSPNIYNFYLDFLDRSAAKRISYSSSFGVDHWEYNERQTENCRRLAHQFKAISVREKSGIALCKNYLGVEAAQCLDPTLLIPKDEYIQKFCEPTYGHPKKKIFRYILDSSAKKNKIIEHVTKYLCAETFSHQPNIGLNSRAGKNIEDYTYPTVEGWINSFNKSDFVVTDSFHGCVFSIIFNKPFIAIGNQQRGLARFTSLLDTFNLSDRLIEEDLECHENLLELDINWESVNIILEQQRKFSIDFIKKSLSDE